MLMRYIGGAVGHIGSVATLAGLQDLIGDSTSVSEREIDNLAAGDLGDDYAGDTSDEDDPADEFDDDELENPQNELAGYDAQ